VLIPELVTAEMNACSELMLASSATLQVVNGDSALHASSQLNPIGDTTQMQTDGGDGEGGGGGDGDGGGGGGNGDEGGEGGGDGEGGGGGGDGGGLVGGDVW
jgi:hypothetical protein